MEAWPCDESSASGSNTYNTPKPKERTLLGMATTNTVHATIYDFLGYRSLEPLQLEEETFDTLSTIQFFVTLVESICIDMSLRRLVNLAI
jgi:hypothetical protein